MYSLMTVIFSIAALFQRRANTNFSDVSIPDFERLYQENFEFVWRTVRALGVSPEVIDDAVQEVFIVIHRRLPDYVPTASLRSWIFGVVRRVAKDFRRSSKRRGINVTVDDETLGSELGDPYVQATRHQALSIVLSFADTLDDEWRSIFVLSELEELSVPEIATALQLNLNTVYTRIRSLRKQLTRYVTEHAGEERGALYE